MPIATIPLTSFTGGEWSPRLHGRVDVEKYNTACRRLENMVTYPHGGITRRMGLEYIEDAKNDLVRLIPFEYNREQAYVLEFGHLYVRIYRNGAQLTDGTEDENPLELLSPYADTELDGVSFVQSADVLYLVHEKHAPMKLTRPGADTFLFGPVVFTGTPADWTTNNYPRAITIFQGRLVLAGVPSKPQNIWLSKTYNFETFTSGESGSSASMNIALAGTQVNGTQWILGVKRKLLSGTTGGEFSVYGSDSGGALTATNIQYDPETNYGSRGGRVQLIGDGVLYASRDGRKLREMSYAYESDGYVSPELSLFSEHLMREGQGIKEFDYAQNPDGILWTVMNNGSFAGLTYLKSQQVQAWHRHSTQGEVQSVCCIESDRGSEVWFAVYRNGRTRIERMNKPFEGETSNDIECTYLDSYLTYEGEPVDQLSGLGHLEGKTVSVLADGVELTDKVVIDGQITLELMASKIVVGLRYRSTVIPLSLEGGSPYGFSQGKRRRIEELIVRFERTAGVSHRLPDMDMTLVELEGRSFGENFDNPVMLKTGDYPIQMMSDWNRNAQFEFTTNSPFPLTILMISAKVSVNE